jgi:site-specific recombinase XerC
VKRETVELIEFMLSSGWRMAEACALDFASIDFLHGTAIVDAVSVRVKGRRVLRREFPKIENLPV